MMDEEQTFSGEAETIFIRDLLTVDCAVFDPSRGIIGQSWHLDAEIHGVLADNHCVYDFGKLKQLVRQTAKTSIDHALLIPVGSQRVNFSESVGAETWDLQNSSRGGDAIARWKYTCPAGAVFPIRAVHVKTSTVEQEFNKLLRHRLPASVLGVKTKLREEASEPTAAFFRYTHGIAGHDGLCQRLFHGHRSRVEVFVGDERRPDLEHFICRELFNSEIHIACPNQIVSGNFQVGERGKNGEELCLEFSGSLGRYQATLPADRVLVVEGETSIECITRQLAILVQNRLGNMERVQVRCFEGINKGAVAIV
jgi:6-pyruvoyl-tetrahydropterin synthase